MKDCINYDSEFDCCKVLSDWSDPMPILQPCIESPCKYYEPKCSEPSERPSEPSEKEYGCEVCKHSETCEPNPFGICNKFERK